MRATITCSACGTVLGVPKGGIPKDGLSCNWCGYVTLPDAAPPPAPVEPPARPRRPKDEPVPAAVAAEAPAPSPPPAPKAPPHPYADDEDDNGEPYEPAPEENPKRKCEECGRLIDAKAVICVHCGYDARAGQKAERTFSPIDREWETGWPFQTRLTIFLVFQAINLVTLVISLAQDGSIPVTLFGICFTVFLQAFLVGTYEKLRIRRNKRGQVEITIQWRLCFVPRAPKKVEWRKNEGVAFGHYDATSVVDWFMLFLLLGAGCIGGILFWWLILRSDRFFAALTRDRGYPETYLYRGMNEKQAKEITQIATDVTGLHLTTPL
jgi:hypothetical protein